MSKIKLPGPTGNEIPPPRATLKSKFVNMFSSKSISTSARPVRLILPPSPIPKEGPPITKSSGPSPILKAYFASTGIST